LIIGAVIGGVVNWATHGCQFSWKGLGYFGVGAVAGALSAGIGSGVNVAMAGGSFGAGFMGTAAGVSSTGFFAGALTGAAGGATNGFVSGLGNGVLGGQNILTALGNGANDALKQGLSGGAIGGIYGGIDALTKHTNFFTGTGKFDLSTGYGAHNIDGVNQTVTGKYVGKYDGVNVYESDKCGSYELSQLKGSGGITLPGRGIVVGKGVYSANLDPQLFHHEFGHILQSRIVGLDRYYRVIGSESLASAALDGVAGHVHTSFWTETWANYLSSNHFGLSNWDVTRFPIQNISPSNFLKIMFSPF
jgi:hypothetical protein